jgi:hypothetical protein
MSLWTTVKTADDVLEFKNYPDLNEYDKKFQWMLPDLIDGYKQVAVEEADPTARKPIAQRVQTIATDISQRDVLDKARGVVFAKYPKAAKSRTNPPPHVKVLPRFNSFSDVDNMNLYADVIEEDLEPRCTRRTTKRKLANENQLTELEAPSRTDKTNAVNSSLLEKPIVTRSRGSRRSNDVNVIEAALDLLATKEVNAAESLDTIRSRPNKREASDAELAGALAPKVEVAYHLTSPGMINETYSNNVQQNHTGQIVSLEDTPPPESPLNRFAMTVQPQTGSDKENNFVPHKKNSALALPLSTGGAYVHKSQPSPLMNVSKKRTTKDLELSEDISKKKRKVNEPALRPNRPTMRRTLALAATSVTLKAVPESHQEESAIARVTNQQESGHVPQVASADAFSDQDEVSEKIMNQDQNYEMDPDLFDQIGDVPMDMLSDSNVSREVGYVSLDSVPARTFTWTPVAAASTPASEADVAVNVPHSSIKPAVSTSVPLALSQADVTPSLRTKPTPLDENTSAASYINPDGTIITCFRIAEALRIQSNAVKESVLLSEASKPKPSIEIELFARLGVTYREGAKQVFAFEDIWFPNKPPILRAMHNSWEQCEQKCPNILRDNKLKPAEGGHICRAVLLLNRGKASPNKGEFHAGVLHIRASDWEEVEEIRSIVEPSYQQG